MENTLIEKKTVDRELYEARVDIALVVVERGNGNASAADVIDAVCYAGGTIERGQEVCFRLNREGLITITPRWTLEITEKGRDFLTERNLSDSPVEKMGELRISYHEEMKQLGRQVIDSIKGQEALE